MRDTVWAWLEDDKCELTGLIVTDKKGEIVGFAHLRTFLRPLAASTGLFLDDLFVTPERPRGGTKERGTRSKPHRLSSFNYCKDTYVLDTGRCCSHLVALTVVIESLVRLSKWMRERAIQERAMVTVLWFG